MLRPRQECITIWSWPRTSASVLQISSQACASSCVLAALGARARVGLPLGGREAGGAWRSGGLSREG